MIDFQGKAGLFLAAWLWATPLYAQSDAPGEPVQLPGAEEEQDESAPSVPEVTSNRLVVPGRAGSRDAGIEVGIIGRAAEPVGILSERDGGFGPALWAGTSATRVQILLNQIPVGAPSRTMASLTRRLLLSAAEPETDLGTADVIAALRISRAFDAGLTDAVPQMIDQADHLAGDETLEAVRARAMLLSGDGASACGSATTMRLESDELFWMKLRAYCYARQEFAPAARLTADLLYDLGDRDDLYQVLLDRFAGNARANPSRYFDQPFDELHIALLRETGIAPPVEAIVRTSLRAMRAVAQSSAWSDEAGVGLRLAAAEEAAWGRALSAEDLLSVYASAVPLDPATRGSALNSAGRAGGVMARATYASALRAGGDPVEQGQIVAAALDAAQGAPIESVYAAALGRATRAMPVQDGLAAASADMALVALAAGDLEKAANWYGIAQGSGSARLGRLQALRAALTVIRPSERFAYWPAVSLVWLEQADLGEFPHARLAEQLILFEAFDLESDPVVLDRLSFNEDEIEGYLPPPAVLENMAQAARAGRLGETVANVLVVVGPSGPRGAHPRGLAAAVAALRAVGLEADARALAGEALIGYAIDARTDPIPEDLP